MKACEYVAVSWSTHRPGMDSGFVAILRSLVSEGWEEVNRAYWLPKRIGGACIMRRPKDEPLENDHFREKWFHTRHCLCDECAKKKRDGLRKFTFAELREAMKDKWLKEETTIRSQDLQKRNVELQGRLGGRQETILAQTLRIGELQAAIDEVVSIARERQGNPRRPWQDGRIPTHDAVSRLLGPLASKSVRPPDTTGPGGRKP